MSDRLNILSEGSSNIIPKLFSERVFSVRHYLPVMMNTTNSNSSHYYLEDFLTDQNWNFIICLPLACLYLVVTRNIFKTHRYSFEPLHIFELNILASAALLLINNSLFGFDPHIDSDHFYCGVVHFLGLYNKFSFYFGIISSQLDRFLALYWNVSYKGRVTPELVIKMIFLQKLFILIVLLLFCMFDSPALKCHLSPVSLCQAEERSLHSLASFRFSSILNPPNFFLSNVKLTLSSCRRQ